MSDNYTGSNSQLGKRKIRAYSNGAASKFARTMGFKRRHVSVPRIIPMNIDKAVGKALKKRSIATPEQKYVDTLSTGASLSTTQAVVLLNGLILGTTDNTRIGTKITVTKIEMNGLAQLSATAGGGLDAGKVALFIDRQVGSAAPAFSNLASADTFAPYNHNGASVLIKSGNMDDEFYIIKEWDYSLDARAGVAGAWQGDVVRFKAEIPIRRVVHYNNGNAGTVADIISNAFYLGYIGSQAAGATATSLQYFIRIWYTDS